MYEQGAWLLAPQFHYSDYAAIVSALLIYLYQHQELMIVKNGMGGA